MATRWKKMPRTGRVPLVAGRAIVSALLVALAVAPACRAPRDQVDAVKLAGAAFGTTWSVAFVPAAGEPVPSRVELRNLVEEQLERVDALLSAFREDSELSRFNAAPAEAFAFEPEARKVVSAALDVASETEGAFDPTVGPLVRLWGFGAGASAGPPTSQALEEAQAVVGFSLLSWDGEGRLVREVPGVELDLSGIAKGYGVDAVVNALRALHPAGLMVEIGGDLRVLGCRPDGRPWRLGLQHPEGGLQSVVPMTAGALATSGDYRQRSGEGEQRRTHIIDPRTARPVSPRLASASVIAPSGLEADAVATALVVMGEEEGMAYVEERPWLEALLMLREPGEEQVGSFRPSSGWPSAPESARGGPAR